MATKIQWTEETWNPIVGCSIATAGCSNCYAMRMAWRLANNPATPHYAGTVEKVNGKPVWTGKVAMAPNRVLAEPLRRRKPTMYFVNSMGDLFHENVPDAWIARVWSVMYRAQRHTLQVLTKRADRQRDFLSRCANWEGWITHNGAPPKGYGGDGIIVGQDDNWPLPNVWIGISAERQKEADERIPLLLDTPAAVRFVSVEPMLGAVDLHDLLRGFVTRRMGQHNAAGLWDEGDYTMPTGNRLDWVICGGESGPGARVPEDFEESARSLRDQCAAASVAFFMKQMPKKTPIPADLMVREFPT